jgi:hypothetical protein
VPKYSMCPECEASFVDEVIPPHHFNRKPCPGGATEVKPMTTKSLHQVIELLQAAAKLGNPGKNLRLDVYAYDLWAKRALLIEDVSIERGFDADAPNQERMCVYINAKPQD